MPGRYRPTYRFEIDWNRNGQYNHPESDITDRLLRGNIQYGARPNVDEFRVKTASADGKILISNEDHRYDPDSPNLRVPENAPTV